jgi:DNA invertase Pin-like site-specific DNA recombinase
MARKAKKKVAAKAATRSRKTKKAVAVKSVKARKPAAKKAPRKIARRSAADVAKLRTSVIAGLRSGKSAETVAKQLGISRPYLYRLQSKG